MFNQNKNVMNLMRKGSRASIKGSAEQVELGRAYILPAQVGDQLKAVLLEMPMKFGQMVGPMIEALDKAYRSDVKVNVDVPSPQLLPINEKEVTEPSRKIPPQAPLKPIIKEPEK